mmetsp:Transcript_3119/g.2613  ORF Transcript_3119/g.2613 Transcript_3119/m.2613 type:complete len:108 (+) Transcript_3119:124-447(+)
MFIAVITGSFSSLVNPFIDTRIKSILLTVLDPFFNITGVSSAFIKFVAHSFFCNCPVWLTRSAMASSLELVKESRVPSGMEIGMLVARETEIDINIIPAPVLGAADM